MITVVTIIISVIANQYYYARYASLGYHGYRFLGGSNSVAPNSQFRRHHLHVTTDFMLQKIKSIFE